MREIPFLGHIWILREWGYGAPIKGRKYIGKGGYHHGCMAGENQGS